MLFYKTICLEQLDLAVHLSIPDLKYFETDFSDTLKKGKIKKKFTYVYVYEAVKNLTQIQNSE